MTIADKAWDMDQQIKLARDLKESMGWEDLGPMLVCYSEGKVMLSMLAVDKDVWPVVIKVALRQLHPEVVALVTDAYQLTLSGHPDEADTATYPAPGELQRRWEGGDRDGISETLTVVVYDGQDMRSIFQPYDAETKTWGESHQQENPVGTVPEMLVAGWPR